jgi:hypothetical protein
MELYSTLLQLKELHSTLLQLEELYSTLLQLKDFLKFFQTHVTLNVTITVDRKCVCLNKTEVEKT